MFQGLNPSMGKRFFSSPKCLAGSGANAASHSLDSGIHPWGCEVNNSPPSSAKVKNEWSYTPPPSVCLHGMDRDRIHVTQLRQVAR
jgi:hypothetical protein